MTANSQDASIRIEVATVRDGLLGLSIKWIISGNVAGLIESACCGKHRNLSRNRIELDGLHWTMKSIMMDT